MWWKKKGVDNNKVGDILIRLDDGSYSKVTMDHLLLQALNEKSFEEKSLLLIRQSMKIIPPDLDLYGTSDNLVASFKDETSRRNLREFCFSIYQKSFFKHITNYYFKQYINYSVNNSKDFGQVMYARGALGALHQQYFDIQVIAHKLEVDKRNNNN